MASYSANDIIRKALTKARVIHPSDTIPSGKASDAFENLNDMLEGWALEKLMVMGDVLETHTLTAGDAEYSWGSGGDIATGRPIEVLDEIFVRSGSTDYPVGLKDLGLYRRMPNKSTTGRPVIIAINYTYPTVAAFLYPTPSAAYVLYLKSQKMAVDVFSDRTTSVDLEPGYGKAIIENLATIICTDYGKKVPASLAASAKAIKKAIKSANSIPVPPMRAVGLTTMMGGVRSGNITEGPYG